MEYRNRLTILLNRSLSSLSNPFARLLYVASTRDPYTGYYFHDGWASVGAVEEVLHTVKNTHLSIFEGVLDLPLEEICGQLHEHFNSLEGSDREIAKKWLEGEPFRDAIPEGSSTLQREFFISQMRAALWILVASSNLGVLPERYASRLQQPVPQFPHHQET
jgi:hypothetical protein